MIVQSLGRVQKGEKKRVLQKKGVYEKKGEKKSGIETGGRPRG